MRGRHSNPAGLRKLLGSKQRPYHKDRLPEDATAPGEAIAVQVDVGPPAYMPKAERAFWDYFAPLLASAKVLTPADRETLGDYCRACAAVVEIGQRRNGVLRKRRMDEDAQGLLRMFDSQLRGWIERKTKIAGELGLTAISRTRVAWSGHAQVIDQKAKPQSKLAELQATAAELRRPMGVKR